MTLQCQHYCDVSERVLAPCAIGRVWKKLALQLDLATGHIFNVGFLRHSSCGLVP